MGPELPPRLVVEKVFGTDCKHTQFSQMDDSAGEGVHKLKRLQLTAQYRCKKHIDGVTTVQNKYIQLLHSINQSLLKLTFIH